MSAIIMIMAFCLYDLPEEVFNTRYRRIVFFVFVSSGITVSVIEQQGNLLLAAAYPILAGLFVFVTDYLKKRKKVKDENINN